MNLTCPNCHRPLAPDDVDLKTSIGRCLECGRVFHLYDQIREATEGPDRARARAEVGQPAGLKLRRDAGVLEMRYAWFTPAALFLVFFSIFWWGFLVVWYAISFAMEGGEAWIMRLFPILHVLAGFWVAWKALTGLVNKTTLRATNDGLEVKHGPIPGRRGITIARADLEQLFTVEEPGKTTTWQLRARTRDRKVHKLLTELSDPDLSLFVEREVERFYGIIDREVQGELPR